MKTLDGIPAGSRNLSLDATASSPDPRRLDGTPPRVSVQGAIDGNPETFWDEIDGQPEYRLTVTFKNATRLSALRLTLAFPPVECRSLELVITGCYGGSPAIRELELYVASFGPWVTSGNP